MEALGPERPGVSKPDPGGERQNRTRPEHLAHLNGAAPPARVSVAPRRASACSRGRG